MKYFLFFFTFFFQLEAYCLSQQSKIEGMLVGAFYGDAYSGPFEFMKYPSQNLKLSDYTSLASPFRTFQDYAKAGNVTDDSRHKIIFIKSLVENLERTSVENIASAYIAEYRKKDQYSELRTKWLDQFYNLSLFQVDPKHSRARDINLFFSGTPTLLGHMIFSPLAAIYPAQQKRAYHHCWEINFFDLSSAKDINCSIIAALSTLLDEEPKDFNDFFASLVSYDHWSLSKIPYVGRPLYNYLKAMMEMLEKTKNKSDHRFLKSLSRFVNAKYWWEDYAGLIVTLAILHRTNETPEKALPLINLFGKDSDSYSQLAGAILGAIHGPDFFPREDVIILKKSLIEQESFDFDKTFKRLYESK